MERMQTIDVDARGFKWKIPIDDVLAKPFLSAESEDHEPHITRFIQMYLSDGDIAIDIGACFGFHTLELARQVGPLGKVYAFEPQHEMFKLLKHNVYVNELQNTSVYCVALGDVVMEVCMYNAYLDNTNYGDSFVSWKYKNDGYTCHADIAIEDFISKAGQYLLINKKSVSCTLLDTFHFESRVKFVKMDVQGFELMVLRGAVDFISEHRPVMIIEFEDNCMAFHQYTTKELIEWLTQHDYDVLLLDHSYPCDHVCVPAEQAYEFYKRFKGHIHPHTENNPINNNVQHGVRKKICI